MSYLATLFDSFGGGVSWIIPRLTEGHDSQPNKRGEDGSEKQLEIDMLTAADG